MQVYMGDHFTCMHLSVHPTSREGVACQAKVLTPWQQGNYVVPVDEGVPGQCHQGPSTHQSLHHCWLNEDIHSKLICSVVCGCLWDAKRPQRTLFIACCNQLHLSSPERADGTTACNTLFSSNLEGRDVVFVCI